MPKAIEILFIIEIAVLILITLRFAITVWMDFIKDISRSSEMPKFKASIEASVKSLTADEVNIESRVMTAIDEIIAERTSEKTA